ncbi:MAG: hypothetical protein LW720_06650 [Pirellula sp.]|nr:hypothetical protein [Pirellula sp.]
MSSYEFDNSKRPEEPVLDTALDTMLDAMLQEWLEGDAGGDQGSSKVFDPGEIYRSVLKRSETSVFSDQEHAQAISRAQREFLQEGLQESGPDKLEGPSAKPQGGLKNPASGRLWTERFWRSAAIAASIAVSIGGLSLIGRWVQSDLNKPVEVGQTSLDGAPSSGPRLPEAREPEAREPEAQVAEAQVAEPTAKGKQEGMVADSRIVDGALDPERRGPMQDKLAVQRQIEQNQEQVDAQVASEGSKMASALPSARGLSLGTLEDREIVSVIDSQFQQIWKSLGMPESDMVSGGQASLKKRGLTADRIARLLLHRVATDSELEAMRLDRLGEDTQLERLVANWISSDEFDRVWSTRLANFYMGGRIESSQQAVVFREWLAAQIRDDLPLEQVQRQVLLGLSQADHPANFLVGYWSDRGDRWSLPADSPQVAWVGFSDTEVKRLEGLSQLFLTVTSNPAMVCTQCHGVEGDSAPSWLAERAAPGGGLGGGLGGSKSVDFDSIAALMVGIAQPGVSELFRRQQDDQVRKIAARLPDGKRVGSELSFEQAIDGWLEQGSHSHSGLLNALWRDFFGVGLESAFGLDGAVALEARRDLVGYLGKQIVERRAGLRQVVYWMLMSDPARQSEESLTYAQYMVMDAQRLEDYLQRQEVFKSLVLDDSRSAVRDEAWLVGYASALFPEQTQGPERSFLAQPSNQVQGGSNRPSAQGLDTGLDQGQWPRGLLHAEIGYRVAGDRARRWADLLSASELSDSALIDHAYLMTKHRFATAREFRAWSSTSWTKSQRSSAILRLLMGVASVAP